jgi:alpha-galactosidase
MNRRCFFRTTGLSLASLLLKDTLFGNTGNGRDMSTPDEVTAILNDRSVTLAGKNGFLWTFNDLNVILQPMDSGLRVLMEAPLSSLSSVTFHWKKPRNASVRVMNDHWERTYGDVSWHEPAGQEILPWYFMEYDGTRTSGCGVKTGAAAFCYWQSGNDRLSLTLDTRTGCDGVQLGDRRLQSAEIVVIESHPGESPFETTRRFTRMMCEKPRMPKHPVYGINDWYFTYGENSEELIVKHTELMAPMADGLTNRPFSVIDAGWFEVSPLSPKDRSWGRMDVPNTHFGAMDKLAEKMRRAGMRPGLWTRPLCARHDDPKTLILPPIKGRGETQGVLDPTIPENLERMRSYFALYNTWGYDLVKFDYTTFDLFGKWGFQMLTDRAFTSPNWHMHDTSKTNAEIVLDLYRTIREAAGDTIIISCNTISHLSAGLFELNRIGDDTSGNEWARTRKMGVNSLAFRGVHHGAFYAADPDCVGLTTKVPWEKNKLWMELVAKSGTPLFISAQQEALQTAQKASTRDCFRIAAGEQPLGEPLDWMRNPFPKQWKLQGQTMTFDWD